MDALEVARLQAVERATRALLARPGHITRAEVQAAVDTAAPVPGADPFPETFEETF